ncbi:hypothetical protein QYF36_017423 [Acer negundo]|nr:hypothetical protein QYF36_017423 [Acer negundo]
METIVRSLTALSTITRTSTENPIDSDNREVIDGIDEDFDGSHKTLAPRRTDCSQDLRDNPWCLCRQTTDPEITHVVVVLLELEMLRSPSTRLFGSCLTMAFRTPNRSS